MIRLVLAPVALVLVALGFVALRRRRLIDDLPTSKVKGVFLGLNEVKGTCRPEAPLLSPLAGTPCATYSWTIEEHFRRTETYQEDGQTKTRTVDGWENVGSGSSSTPFWLDDDTGSLWIQPDGARLQQQSVLSREADRSDPVLLSQSVRSIHGGTGRYRFSEQAIPVGAALYVLGTARLREHVVAPEIAKAKGDPFIVSVKEEAKVASGYGWWARGAFVLGAGAAAVAGSAGGGVGAAVGVLAFAVVWFAAWLVLVYNGLVRVRTRVDNAWAMVETELARRHDLVPNLSAVVEAAAANERITQSQLTAIRSGAGRVRTPSGGEVRTATGEAQQQSGALTQLLARVERYPTLSTDALFAQLRAQLVDCEDRLAFGRGYFNDAVTAFRNRAGTFPGSLVARVGTFPSAELFLAEGFERSVPAVRFDQPPS